LQVNIVALSAQGDSFIFCKNNVNLTNSQIAGAAKRVHILVKPTRADLITNLIINTDRRTYHLELRATETTSLGNTGTSRMCTLHANTAREAVTKMCTLPLLDGENRRPRHPSPARAARVPQRTAWRAELGQRPDAAPWAGPRGPSSTARSMLLRGLSELVVGHRPLGSRLSDRLSTGEVGRRAARRAGQHFGADGELATVGDWLLNGDRLVVHASARFTYPLELRGQQICRTGGHGPVRPTRGASHRVNGGGAPWPRSANDQRGAGLLTDLVTNGMAPGETRRHRRQSETPSGLRKLDSAGSLVTARYGPQFATDQKPTFAHQPSAA